MKISIIKVSGATERARRRGSLMTTWQIFISVTGTLYAAAMLFVVFASIHDLTSADRKAPAPRFCPAGSTCRLCIEAQELEAAVTA